MGDSSASEVPQITPYTNARLSETNESVGAVPEMKDF